MKISDLTKLPTRVQVEDRIRQLWRENLAANLPLIQHTSGSFSSWAGRYTSELGVVVAAGPSLDRNIHLLRDYRERIRLFVVDMAIKPLARIGIEPDLAVSVDGLPIVGRMYRGLPTETLPFLACVHVHPEVLDAHLGEKFFFVPAYDSPLDLHLQSLIPQRVPTLPVWGTVAYTTLLAALWSGCCPIVIVGLDLAFTGGQRYVTGSVFEELGHPPGGNPITREDMDREICVGDGPPLPTNSAFLFYLQGMEQLVSCFPGDTFINSTEGGIVGIGESGFLNLPLAQALDSYTSKTGIAYIHRGRAYYRRGWRERALRELRQAIVHLEEGDGPEWTDLGALLLQLESFEEAELACRKAISARPDHPVAHTNLGVCLANRNAFSEAVQFWRTSLRLDPDQPDIVKNLAVLEGAGILSGSRLIERSRNGPCPCGSGKRLKRCCGG